MRPADLARATNVSPTTVWHWEKHGTIPRPKKLEELARALDVTPDYLLTGKDEGAPYAAPEQATTPAERRPTTDRPSVDEIMERAQAEIAAALGMAPSRVKVRFEVT
jgi:transcriptional regulator with XRE-family HTH domain